MDNLSPNLAPETNETLRSVETPVACISSAAMANDPPTSTMVERRPPWQPPKRFYEGDSVEKEANISLKLGSFSGTNQCVGN